MSRKLFKRWMPTRERLRRERSLRIFGDLLLQPNLWGINRDAVTRAIAIGLFWAMIPMPFQMIPAAFFAIRFRANVALSMALVWITNPVTMPAIFYATYRFGRWLLVLPEGPQFAFTAEAMQANLAAIWLPLYAGSIVTGALLASFGFFVVNLAWRWNTVRRWRNRKRTPPLREMQDGPGAAA